MASIMDVPSSLNRRENKEILNLMGFCETKLSVGSLITIDYYLLRLMIYILHYP